MQRRGRFYAPPKVFANRATKLARSAAVFVTPIGTSIAQTVSKNFNPDQVRSGHQATLCDSTSEKSKSRLRHSFCPIDFKPLGDHRR